MLLRKGILPNFHNSSHSNYIHEQKWSDEEFHHPHLDTILQVSDLKFQILKFISQRHVFIVRPVMDWNPYKIYGKLQNRSKGYQLCLILVENDQLCWNRMICVHITEILGLFTLTTCNIQDIVPMVNYKNGALFLHHLRTQKNYIVSIYDFQ